MSEKDKELQDTLNGCKTRNFKYGYLDVRKSLIVNVDFEDPQLTQRVSKIPFDLNKERIKWDISQIATGTQIPI